MLGKKTKRFFLVLFIVFFNFAFVLGVIFIKKALSIEPITISGQVLGASEAIYDEPMSSENILPDNEDKLIVPKMLDNAIELDLEARGGAVIDCQSGNFLFKKDADRPVPIASITKLATAYTFLDINPGWEQTYIIKPTDIRTGGKIYLKAEDEVKIRDLFYLSLVGSANTAAASLVSATGLTESEFVEAMNNKMAQLGLKHTSFRDPVGLSYYNLSTAEEIVQLALIALNNEFIQEATLTKQYHFNTSAGRSITVNSTDSLLEIFPYNNIELLGGKTGYTNAAGYCFVGKFQDQAGHEIISVVLGGDYPNSRFKETKAMVDWVYGSYGWE